MESHGPEIERMARHVPLLRREVKELLLVALNSHSIKSDVDNNTQLLLKRKFCALMR
jgi:hypothetical protein